MGRARRLLPMLSFTNSAEADQTEPKEGKRGRFRNLGHLIEPSLERAASSLPTTQPSVGAQRAVGGGARHPAGYANAGWFAGLNLMDRSSQARWAPPVIKASWMACAIADNSAGMIAKCGPDDAPMLPY